MQRTGWYGRWRSTQGARLSGIRRDSETITDYCADRAAGMIADALARKPDIRIFELSQKAADLWGGSNNTLKRELLETLSLNRNVSNVSLCITKRKPFDILAARPKIEKNRGERT